MIKVAICDDSQVDADKLESILEVLPYKMEVDVFYTGSNLLEYLEEQHEEYHLFILDIELEDMNGLELAKKIRKTDKQCFISFMSSHPEYVYDTFEIMVFDYLVKPIREERVIRLVKRAKELLEKQGSLFSFHFNKAEYELNTDEILVFQKNKRLVEIVTHEDVLHTYMTMNEVMEQLNEERFARISYSCVVNLKYVESIQGSVVIMQNGMNLNISRNLLRDVKTKHLEYLCGGIRR